MAPPLQSILRNNINTTKVDDSLPDVEQGSTKGLTTGGGGGGDLGEDSQHSSSSSSKKKKKKNNKSNTKRRSSKRVHMKKKLSFALRNDNGSDSGSITGEMIGLPNWVITVLIIVLGLVTCAAFMGVGIQSAFQDQQDLFAGRAQDLETKIQRAWQDYVTAASWIHGRCRSRDFTRTDFRQVYEYLIQSGLDFQAAQFDPNITRDERAEAEEEARTFYAENYPHVQYRGIIGFEYANSTSLEPRSQQDFYFPIHYMEPVVGNEAAIDLDYHASGSRKRTVLFCMENGQPALTDRLRLVQEQETSPSFGVVLMHPGFPLDGEPDVWPRDLASIVIRIPDLLKRSAGEQGDNSAVYLYDNSDSSGQPIFLGAVKIVSKENKKEAELTFLPEQELEDVRTIGRYKHQRVIAAANKEWTVYIHSLEDNYRPQITFVILGGVIIFLSSLCLASWVHTNSSRVEQFNRMRADADAERAALILDNARQATKAERELNDFIAHEVRNPVAAAMSACSFVKTAVHEKNPLSTEHQQKETQEDVDIIENALRFVNDLLRNMLDMHRAANKKIKVNMTPTDILHDVLEPVHAMLPQRDAKFKVLVECPDGLMAMADGLRLKQVCLNLARNSVKFIDEGFIRLKAEVVNEEVHILIEDSGPGIPLEKREMLFAKFQESLDSLSQGTGIGLFLCKNLVELMEGDIRLDKEYDSGVKGYPGTRFQVNLKQPALDHHFINEYNSQSGTGETSVIHSDEDDSMHLELPEKLSVLFVDDDPILRKLFSRTVKTVAPGWVIREAANGETAVRLVDEDHFDLIFMDMYMASVEKQMLGTETVKTLRGKGVEARICGLSANDKEMEFLDAGADSFTFKPFPCEARALTQELCRVWFQEHSSDDEDVLSHREEAAKE